MSELRYDVDAFAKVSIFVSDEAPADVISRATQPDFPYRIPDTDATLRHLAYNAVANGVEDANRLDGWADLDFGILTMRVEVVDTEVST